MSSAVTPSGKIWLSRNKGITFSSRRRGQRQSHNMWLVQEPVLSAPHGNLRTRAKTQFRQDVLYMGGHSRLAHDKNSGDAAVGVPASNQRSHLALPRAERIQICWTAIGRLERSGRQRL